MSGTLLLLGLDGADPGFVRRHLSALPNLAHLIRTGTWGKLRSTIPPVTGPAWGTAMSGMNPGKTGTAGFVKADFATSTQELIDSHSVAVPRIWNVLSHLGRRVGVVGVPLTYPVEEVNGVMVGGFLTPSTDTAFTFPPELGEGLAQNGYQLSASGKEYEYQERDSYLRNLYQSSAVKFNTVLRLLDEQSWDCFVFVLSETDWIQHFFDRPALDPDHELDERILLEYFQFVDEGLGQMIEKAGEDAYVVLMSDHGFGRFLKANVHINAWLSDRGYLCLKNDGAVTLRHRMGARIRSLARLPGFRFVKNRLPEVRATGYRLTKANVDDIDWQSTKAHFYNVFGTFTQKAAPGGIVIN